MEFKSVCWGLKYQKRSSFKDETRALRTFEVLDQAIEEFQPFKVLIKGEIRINLENNPFATSSNEVDSDTILPINLQQTPTIFRSPFMSISTRSRVF